MQLFPFLVVVVVVHNMANWILDGHRGQLNDRQLSTLCVLHPRQQNNKEKHRIPVHGNTFSTKTLRENKKKEMKNEKKIFFLANHFVNAFARRNRDTKRKEIFSVAVTTKRKTSSAFGFFSF